MSVPNSLCERCGKNHDCSFGSGRFCSDKCARARVVSEETKAKLSILGKREKSAEWKREISKAFKGRFTGKRGKGFSLSTPEINAKKSASLMNRKFSDEHRRNLRISVAKRVQASGGFPRFNHKACELIDIYGKEHGFNFQHALNGGEFHIKELGYWVDGYDKEKNVVIEIDEKYNHCRKGAAERDEKRQREIENFLGCTFIRIKI
jgi:hypothetical protein